LGEAFVFPSPAPFFTLLDLVRAYVNVRTRFSGVPGGVFLVSEEISEFNGQAADLQNLGLLGKPRGLE